MTDSARSGVAARRNAIVGTVLLVVPGIASPLWLARWIARRAYVRLTGSAASRS